jgi:uncharacterized membrane protein YfcA
MKTAQLLSPLNKTGSFSTLTSKSISIIRVAFYLISALILIQLGLQIEHTDPTQVPGTLQLVLYFIMGIIAATIANATGAGGGIVFLPVFMSLGFSPLESISTSIAIQCFGMTSGALTWISYRSKELKEYSKQWKPFYSILLISALSSVVGVLITQQWMPQSPIDITLFFALFSLVIGSLILFRTLRVNKGNKAIKGRTHALGNMEIFGLICVSLTGGVITPWLSIGVGEILLIYLIVLGFRLNVAVAVAVCVSAISVLVILPYHISSHSISLDVLIYAAPGALIGGVIARSLATYLGMYKLKMAASGWIILSSIPHLVSSI